MVALTLRLESELWQDASREAAQRAVSVDTLICEALCERFNAWRRDPPSPIDRLTALDARVSERLTALAPFEGLPSPIGLNLSGALSDSGLFDAAAASWRWTASSGRETAAENALVDAMGDALRDQLESLDEWRVAMTGGEAANRRGQHAEAARRFGEAATLSDRRMLIQLALEREVASHLLDLSPGVARRVAQRARDAAIRHGDDQTATAFATLASLCAEMDEGPKAVRALIAGVFALEQRLPRTAVERLSQAAELADAQPDRATGVRARSALAIVRLAMGQSADATREALGAIECAGVRGDPAVVGILEVVLAASRLAPSAA